MAFNFENPNNESVKAENNESKENNEDKEGNENRQSHMEKARETRAMRAEKIKNFSQNVKQKASRFGKFLKNKFKNTLDVAINIANIDVGDVAKDVATKTVEAGKAAYNAVDDVAHINIGNAGILDKNIGEAASEIGATAVNAANKAVETGKNVYNTVDRVAHINIGDAGILDKNAGEAISEIADVAMDVANIDVGDVVKDIGGKAIETGKAAYNAVDDVAHINIGNAGILDKNIGEAASEIGATAVNAVNKAVETGKNVYNTVDRVAHINIGDAGILDKNAGEAISEIADVAMDVANIDVGDVVKDIGGKAIETGKAAYNAVDDVAHINIGNAGTLDRNVGELANEAMEAVEISYQMSKESLNKVKQETLEYAKEQLKELEAAKDAAVEKVIGVQNKIIGQWNLIKLDFIKRRSERKKKRLKKKMIRAIESLNNQGGEGEKGKIEKLDNLALLINAL